MKLAFQLLAVLLIGVLGTPTFSQAQQSAKITGTVVDAETGETLIGVNVLITGTTRGTATDLDGQYTIRNLDPGTYSLTFSYISYDKKVVEGIALEAGETEKIDIALSPQSKQLGEIVVSARAVQDNETALLAKRQKSISFSDAISAEKISQTGAGDAAAAMKKVVGATVVEGKYVFVRGLGNRYTSTHLNGAELPSADPNKKAFQLDLIPSSLIDNITTIKTFTPDKPGNFSGGLVDISTRDFPDQEIFSVSTSSAFNTQATFATGLQGAGSGTDFLGFDNGRREIPAFIRNRETLPQLADATFTFSEDAAENAAILNEASRSFNNELIASSETLPVNGSMGITYGNQLELFGRELGFIAGLTYSSSYTSYDDGRSGIWQLVGDFGTAESLNPLNDLNDQRTDYSVDIGGIFSMGYKLNQNNRVNVSYTRTQSGTSTGRILSGYLEEIDQGGFPTYQSNVIDYKERSLQSIQLRGKNIVTGLWDSELEWQGSIATTRQEQPDIRFFELAFRAGEQDTVYSITPSLMARPTRFFRDLADTKYNAKFDYKIPFQLAGSSNIKVGANYLFTDRDFNESRYEYQQGTGSGFNRFAPDFEAFFNNVGVVDTSSISYIYGNVIQDATVLRNSYTAEKTISAGYVMGTFQVLNALKLVGGARLERAEIRTVSDNPDEPVGELDNTDLLPSVSAIYNVREDLNIRAAFTKTVARPNFRELAPYNSFDAYGGLNNIGNDSLKRTLITNYDIRAEYFPNPGEIFAVSLFYKGLENPIERTIVTTIARTRSWQNVDRGRVFGIEMEARKNLGFIADAFRNFSATTNLTLVRSSVDIPQAELDNILVNDPGASDQRNLVGQSPFIFNFDLAYLNPKLDLQINSSFNTFGDRLSSVTLGANPDVFERTVNSLNLFITKGFGERWTTKISATNLLDPEIKTSAELNGQEYIYASFRRGRTLSFKLQYSF